VIISQITPLFQDIWLLRDPRLVFDVEVSGERQPFFWLLGMLVTACSRSATAASRPVLLTSGASLARESPTRLRARKENVDPAKAAKSCCMAGLLAAGVRAAPQPSANAIAWCRSVRRDAAEPCARITPSTDPARVGRSLSGRWPGAAEARPLPREKVAAGYDAELLRQGSEPPEDRTLHEHGRC